MYVHNRTLAHSFFTTCRRFQGNRTLVHSFFSTCRGFQYWLIPLSQLAEDFNIGWSIYLNLPTIWQLSWNRRQCLKSGTSFRTHLSGNEFNVSSAVCMHTMFTYDQKKDKENKSQVSDTLYKQHLRFFLPILTSLCTAVCDVVKAAILASEAVPVVASMASSWRTASVTGRPPADSLRRRTIGPNGKNPPKMY